MRAPNLPFLTLAIAMCVAISLCSCSTIRDGASAARDRLGASAGVRFTGEEIQLYLAWRKLFEPDREWAPRSEEDVAAEEAALIETLTSKP